MMLLGACFGACYRPIGNDFIVLPATRGGHPARGRATGTGLRVDRFLPSPHTQREPFLQPRNYAIFPPFPWDRLAIQGIRRIGWYADTFRGMGCWNGACFPCFFLGHIEVLHEAM